MTTQNAVSSNAFNGSSFVSSGVDPRTGQYTVSVTLPSLNGNHLCGPELGLSLNFSPINQHNCGYGTGWDIPMTQYNPATRILSLSTGETFKVTGSGAVPAIAEQKIESFKFYVESEDRYRVVHKSGLIEKLSLNRAGTTVLALPFEIHSAQGQVIRLRHMPFGSGFYLSEVKQADGGLLLRTTERPDGLAIAWHGSGGTVLATYVLQVSTARLHTLRLPTATTVEWQFEYRAINDYTCLTSVRSPQGAIETLDYTDGGHAFPGSSRPTLPRVTHHLIIPGQGQQHIESRYEYSAHNFPGHGAQGLVFDNDGLDNLYKVDEPYEYHSVQTLWQGEAAGRNVTSVYNRYHLLVRQQTRNGNAMTVRDTEYPLLEGLAFDLQPPQCQFPLHVSSSWALADDPTRLYVETETTRFDAFGNPLEQIDVRGMRQTWEYYSALGAEGCPPDPYGFTRQLKELRRYPAPAEPQSPRRSASGRRSRKRGAQPAQYPDAPVHISRFTYTALPPLIGGETPTLVLASRTESALDSSGEQCLQRMSYLYVDAPEDPTRHGRLLTTVEELTDNTATTTSSYDFEQYPGFALETHRVKHSLDNTGTEVASLRALYTGEVFESRDADGRVIRYERDQLQRVISETIMPGHPNQATRRFRYQWPSAAGEPTRYYEVDALGVETLTESDGIGRTLRQLRQKADGSSDAEQFRLLYNAQYGQDMDLLSETRYDWLGGTELALTQQYEYDQWDQCCRVIDSTGIGRNTVTDPFTRTVTEWQDGMAKTVTTRNRFDKPLRIDVIDLDGTRQSRQRFFYDGLGQLRRSAGTAGERSDYQYDALGRATRNVLPDNTRLEHQYAAHSLSTLVTRLHVTHGNRALAPLLAGTQSFDALERLTTRHEGRRTTCYIYSAGRTVADARITPSARRIDYHYNLTLTDAPINISAEQETTFEYHPVTRALVLAQSPQASRAYAYDSAGHLQQESSVIDGVTRISRYETSLGGRALRAEHFSGLMTDYRYDVHGRLQQLTEGQLQATFEYNAQGRRSRSTTQDLGTGNTLVTELEYDTQGREVLRTQRLTRAAERVTELRWSPGGALRERELRVDGQLSLLERFIYDPRDRLIEQQCSGPDLPTDRYGNAICEQHFHFDGVDNLLRCVTHFADGSSDEALYVHADDDRCQLRSLSHTHADYPALITFEYDADGNLVRDAEGRQLRYDSQGRLLAVSAADSSALLDYRYDAHDHLLGVTQGGAAATLRFYDQHQLRTTVQGEQARCFSYDGSVPLGQQSPGQDDQTLLTLCAANHSVMDELKGQGAANSTRYDSHGVASTPLDSQLGYNGEVREAQTGWYLLGSGYRAYDPQLKCFHSPDSASPFGAGGLNPYAYCLGNPVRYRDPSGHDASNFHYGQASHDRRMANRKAARHAADMGIMIGLGAIGLFAAVPVLLGASIAAIPVALGVAELAIRSGIEAAYIENDDYGMAGVHTFDAFASLQLIFLPAGFSGKPLDGPPRLKSSSVRQYSRLETITETIEWEGPAAKLITDNPAPEIASKTTTSRAGKAGQMPNFSRAKTINTGHSKPANRSRGTAAGLDYIEHGAGGNSSFTPIPSRQVTPPAAAAPVAGLEEGAALMQEFQKMGETKSVGQALANLRERYKKVGNLYFEIS